MTIGAPMDSVGRGVWSIPAAQEEARRLQTLIDQGRDPRLEKAQQVARASAERIADRIARQQLEVTGLSAWESYCAERQPAWSPRNYNDHVAFAREGGIPRRRGVGKTAPGPLRTLLIRPLASIDADAIEDWVTRESKVRPVRTQLGFRLLRAFVNWCAEHKDFKHIVQQDACKGRRMREKLGRPNARTDVLQREQLALWFTEVRKDANPVAAAYLQCLLLTGARREEMAGLHWDDVDFRWKSMRIRDKVEGERTIPLTPYVAHLLSWLPKRPGNPFVFSSTAAESGRLHSARPNHVRALLAAGLPHVTIHGLRRSFGTLAEWVEVPVGVVAQIQGHKPSAIAEKHYRVRPLDLLRQWHVRVEAWVLEQADVRFEDASSAERHSLRRVA